MKKKIGIKIIETFIIFLFCYLAFGCTKSVKADSVEVYNTYKQCMDAFNWSLYGDVPDVSNYEYVLVVKNDRYVWVIAEMNIRLHGIQIIIHRIQVYIHHIIII